MSWLIAGLGNPGPVYTRTRHNVGYLVVDELRRRANERWTSARAQRADVVRTRIGPVGLGAPGAQTEPVVLMRSRTYMNESGIAVRKVADFSHISPDHLIVVHDELDLDLGRMRLKTGGGDNGHNGLKSIRAHLRTGDFNRVRFGVGRPPGRMNPADYVLSNFPARDQNDLDLQVTLAADAVEMIMTDGLAAAQNRYNT
ncbi:Peptidyl-tRNA hydrolase [Cutibacterium granulosum]|uniref:Peptidyl-tRNA hydrolase n=3 Tax=Cutibacterium granulosum TaxID=33011 RepID=U1GA73_9ACTN|nr:aminoacyl-tRNA hydrolase [Cutibacterium granulosum]MBX7474083.1 aminoacyl-tRNA hydrolase [Streptomyces sp. MAG02]ERF55230.1 aminoacyl-tRNA hydrolase [Cutibacterium granulosum DSM 20700]ERF63997.1 aminoacyl-tRNA hydrolase [Cutibacterium granulosum TM11]KAG9060555.1 aminoacyl-tRNA hydrolase [Cutibacterium granulosum DSM 20700]MBS5254000.1 aminoacyl-tRNA hydrolase [Cutibacterium granulosum]